MRFPQFIRLSFPGLFRLILVYFFSHTTIKSAKISRLLNQPNSHVAASSPQEFISFLYVDEHTWIQVTSIRISSRMLIACYSFVHRCCDTHVIIGSFLNACQLVTWRRRRIVWFFAEMLPVPTCALSLVRGTEMFWNSLPEWYCKLLLPTPWKKYGFFPEWYCCLQLRLALQLLILRKENTSVLLIWNVVSFFETKWEAFCSGSETNLQ